MLTTHLNTVIARELRTLKQELLAYPDEADMWATPDGVTNSGATLALHLCGNLQHFFGAVLGGSGYVRERDAEFAGRDVPRDEILAEIDRTIAAVSDALTAMDDDALGRAPAFDFGKITVDADEFVLHLLSHLAFHLGQVNYHRRIVTGERGDVKVIAIPELGTVRRKNED